MYGGDKRLGAATIAPQTKGLIGYSCLLLGGFLRAQQGSALCRRVGAARGHRPRLGGAGGRLHSFQRCHPPCRQSKRGRAGCAQGECLAEAKNVVPLGSCRRAGTTPYCVPRRCRVLHDQGTMTPPCLGA